MKRPRSLAAKLSKCDLEVKLYVEQVEGLNRKLHNQVAKLEAQNVDYQHEIFALKKAAPKLQVNIVKFADSEDGMAPDAVKEK
jgi:hypothetical protein